MTKNELKDLYGAPKEEDFETKEEYLEAKFLWTEANPDQYEEILAAPE